jgi:hypothetical protein
MEFEVLWEIVHGVEKESLVGFKVADQDRLG